MARSRRGFGPPELKGTLGTLLRTTLQQASAVRDVIERGARSRIDDMRHNRRRQDALAELGEIVLELVQRGEIDLDELPEARAIVEQLLDDGHAHPHAHAHAHDHREHEPEIAPPPSRSRFDDRRGKDSDGTVASSRWSPPTPKAAAPAKVWRPEVSIPQIPHIPPAKAAAPASRKGGISFEDDDLAEYMHPDDVPPKDADS